MNGFISSRKTRENAFSQARFQLGKCLRMPIAHGEGRLLFPKEKEEHLLKKLIDEDMLVFRYCDKDGKVADGKYPNNPNGSFYDIAGICNKEGNIFGLMPHPERAMYWWQQPDWTSQTPDASVRRWKTNLPKHNRQANQEVLNP